MPAVLQFVLEGPELTDEVLEILQKVRDIEQRSPTREFKLFVDAPTMSKDRLKVIFSKIKPPLPYVMDLPL